MTIYDEFLAREGKIWPTFKKAMRFTFGQVTERAVIFGVFSGAYKNGLGYLEALDAFELVLIVDTYNQRMADLDAREQNFIIDIATRRYIANVDKLIHDNEMVTKREGIAAEDEEWDARFEALSADQAAIETLESRLAGKQRDIEARIKTLQAQILVERANLSLAELSVLEKELDVARAQNRLTGKDVELARKDIEIIRKWIELTSKDVTLSQKDIEIQEASLRLLKLALDSSEAELKILEAGLDASRIQLRVIEAGLKSLDYQKEAATMEIQAANYEADIAKTARIQVDKSEAELENTIAGIGVKEKDIQLVEADADLAKIENQKKEIDLEYLNTDEKIARTNINITKTEGQIAETDEIQARLDQVGAEYDGDVAKLALLDAEKGIMEGKEASVLEEITAAGERLTNDAAIHQAELDNMNTKAEFDKDRLDIQKQDKLAQYDERSERATTEYEIVSDQQTDRDAVANSQILNIEENARQQENKYEAEVEYLQTIMEAEIMTTLRHSIGKDV